MLYCQQRTSQGTRKVLDVRVKGYAAMVEEVVSALLLQSVAHKS